MSNFGLFCILFFVIAIGGTLLYIIDKNNNGGKQ